MRRGLLTRLSSSMSFVFCLPLLIAAAAPASALTPAPSPSAQVVSQAVSGLTSPSTAAGRPVLLPQSVLVGPGAKLVFRTTVPVAAGVRRTVVLERLLEVGWSPVTSGKTNAKGKVRLQSVANRYASETSYRVVASKVTAGGKRLAAVRTQNARVKVEVPVLAPGTPGSEEAPLRPGQTFTTGKWTMALGITDTEGWPEIAAANAHNTAPAAGWTYLIVPLTMTNQGPSAASPWLNTTVVFRGSNGELFDVVGSGGSCGVVPDSVTLAPDVKPGATAVANQCAVVPTWAVSGGRWLVRGDFTAPVFQVLPS